MSIRRLGVCFSLILMGAVGASVGCGDPVDALGDGSLQLEWEVNPLGCEGADIERVQVSLQSAYQTYEESFRCTDSGAILSGIEAGTYELEVSGNNDVGRPIFSVKPRKVTVSAEKLNTTSMIRLTAKPSEVQVVWGFENGLVCGANGVSKLEIAFYDDQSFEHERFRVSCDAGSATAGDLFAGDYIVEVSSVDSEVKFSGFEEIELERGINVDVRVELKPKTTRPSTGEH
ncbi:hypothetical protein [Bradymonas sediminis]|nr:hypothetical protein [Bradymonas sediminis]TDP77573.1 hypothetical protein DFR33_101475 [Bradymonas sediminis]